MNIGTLSLVTEAKQKDSIKDKAYRVATFPIVAGSGITGAVVGGVTGATIGGLTGAIAGGSIGTGISSGLLYGKVDSREKKFNVSQRLNKKFKNWERNEK